MWWFTLRLSFCGTTIFPLCLHLCHIINLFSIFSVFFCQYRKYVCAVTEKLFNFFSQFPNLFRILNKTEYLLTFITFTLHKREIFCWWTESKKIGEKYKAAQICIKKLLFCRHSWCFCDFDNFQTNRSRQNAWKRIFFYVK